MCCLRERDDQFMSDKMTVMLPHTSSTRGLCLGDHMHISLSYVRISERECCSSTVCGLLQHVLFQVTTSSFFLTRVWNVCVALEMKIGEDRVFEKDTFLPCIIL